MKIKHYVHAGNSQVFLTKCLSSAAMAVTKKEMIPLSVSAAKYVVRAYIQTTLKITTK